MRTCLIVLLATSIAGAQRLYHQAGDEVPMTGQPVKGCEHVDEFFSAFIVEHDLPGVSVAIARDGDVVYARGFGWADVSERRPVGPDTLFRLASISKPITSVAILELVEDGHLSLDDKPFQMLDTLDPDTFADERLNDITVDHLLRHRAGFDRRVSGDPMFMSRRIADEENVTSPPDAETIVRWITRRPLDTAPGEQYAYSNVGYAVLGLLVEQVTAMTYEDYVRTEILAPLGIEQMRAARTREPAPGEARYYTRGSKRPSVFDDADVEPPYGAWAIEPMIAHGGWIASSVDLVRFASAIGSDDFVLSPESIEIMFSSPEDKGDGAAHYARGWLVRHWAGVGRNTWHGGSLPGTSTLLVRRHDGLCWAVLFNTREGMALDGQPAGAIDGRMHQLVDQVDHWPSPQ